MRVLSLKLKFPVLNFRTYNPLPTGEQRDIGKSESETVFMAYSVGKKSCFNAQILSKGI